MLKVIALIAAALVAIGYFVTVNLVNPIGSDLTVIGQGKPTLVLAYENYSPVGGEALNRLSEVKSDYDSRLEFVVADMGSPAGLRFAEQYQLLDGQAVFLTDDGQLLRATRIPLDEQELRAQLDSNLAEME